MWPIAIARVLTVLQKDATATFDWTDSTLIGALPVCVKEREGEGEGETRSGTVVVVLLVPGQSVSWTHCSLWYGTNTTGVPLPKTADTRQQRQQPQYPRLWVEAQTSAVCVQCCVPETEKRKRERDRAIERKC